MKNLVYLLAIILILGTFSLNASSGTQSEKTRLEVPVQKFAGFKKDISTAD
jgi:hypothetical protein